MNDVDERIHLHNADRDEVGPFRTTGGLESYHIVRIKIRNVRLR